jgi:hypothetical protein
MTIQEQTDKLKLRVKTGISNPDEFLNKEELFTYATEETNGIVGSKDLADAFVMDIAYYRFLLLADITATEQNESDYKLALSMLKHASNKKTDQTTGTTSTTVPVLVKVRPNNYE